MIRHNFPGLQLFKELVIKIRLAQIANLLMACVLILVEGCLGSSAPVGSSPVVVSIEGLSVVVQPNDGTYEIRTGNGAHSVIHARVAAEIDHKWVKSTDY